MGLASCVLVIACVICLSWVLQLQWNLPWSQLLIPTEQLPLEAMIVKSSVLSRMAIAVLVGGSLALATMLLQQVMLNPLASDSTLAVSAGAQTALLIATVFSPTLLLYGTSMITFIGALITLMLVLWLASACQQRPLLTIVLAGLVMSLYLGSVSGVITLFYSEETRGMMLWGSGSLIQDGWQDVYQLLWRIGGAMVIVLFLVKPLSIMGLSDDQAAALGISVRKVRLITLVVVAFLSANVVSTVGMMGFIGLAAVTVVRQLGVRTLLARLIMSFVMGALMLLLTDAILLLIEYYHGLALPTGSVTALIGSPLILWLMLKSSPQQSMHGGQKQTTSSGKSSVNFLYLLSMLAVTVLLLALFLGKSAEGWQLSFNPIFLELRYPRLLTAAATGVMLATTGVILQRLTQNPMASPELLGISSGTAMGAMAAVLIWNVTPDGMGFWLAGLLASLLTLGLIMLFNQRSGLQPEKILLTGVAVAALADAALRIWTAGGDLRVQQLLIWLSGSTYQASAKSAGVVMAISVLLFCLALPLSRWLGLLSVNNVIAQSNGVNVPFARLILVTLSAVLTALATLLIGPLSFIGLLAPHLASMLGARLPKQQLIYAAMIGVVVMVLADWLGRQLLFPYEIPAGLMATLLGGGYFLIILRKLK